MKYEIEIFAKGSFKKEIYYFCIFEFANKRIEILEEELHFNRGKIVGKWEQLPPSRFETIVKNNDFKATILKRYLKLKEHLDRDISIREFGKLCRDIYASKYI